MFEDIIIKPSRNWMDETEKFLQDLEQIKDTPDIKLYEDLNKHLKTLSTEERQTWKKSYDYYKVNGSNKDKDIIKRLDNITNAEQVGVLNGSKT